MTGVSTQLTRQMFTIYTLVPDPWAYGGAFSLNAHRIALHCKDNLMVRMPAVVCFELSSAESSKTMGLLEISNVTLSMPHNRLIKTTDSMILTNTTALSSANKTLGPRASDRAHLADFVRSNEVWRTLLCSIELMENFPQPLGCFDAARLDYHVAVTQCGIVCETSWKSYGTSELRP